MFTFPGECFGVHNVFLDVLLGGGDFFEVFFQLGEFTRHLKELFRVCLYI